MKLIGRQGSFGETHKKKGGPVQDQNRIYGVFTNAF